MCNIHFSIFFFIIPFYDNVVVQNHLLYLYLCRSLVLRNVFGFLSPMSFLNTYLFKELSRSNQVQLKLAIEDILFYRVVVCMQVQTFLCLYSLTIYSKIKLKLHKRENNYWYSHSNPVLPSHSPCWRCLIYKLFVVTVIS